MDPKLYNKLPLDKLNIEYILRFSKKDFGIFNEKTKYKYLTN